MATIVPSNTVGVMHARPSPVYAGVPGGQLQVPVHAIQVVPPSAPRDLHLRSSHFILGSIQMVAGVICFAFEVVGLAIGPHAGGLMGVGVYAGVFFFLPGLLGVLAAVKNSRCLLVACMVMNIIGAVVAVIGISLSSVEIVVFPGYPRYLRRVITGEITFQRVKQGINVTVCVLELVVTIVHASFTCASCCQCCLPKDEGKSHVQRASVPGKALAYNGATMQVMYIPAANPVFIGSQEAGPSGVAMNVNYPTMSAALGGSSDLKGELPQQEAPRSQASPPAYAERPEGRF